MAKKKKSTKRFSYAPRSSKANTQVSAIVEPMISKMMRENPTMAGDITPFVWALVSGLKIGGAVGTGASSIWAGRTISEKLRGGS